MRVLPPAFAFAALLPAALFAAPPQTDPAANALAREVFKELIEINTTDSTGNVTRAAEAMARRLRAGGFATSDMQLLGATARKKNLVVRVKGTGAHKPVLMIGHLDVVEAHREDWSTDPFKFIEKDGYFYGRGTQDMKDGDAIMVTTLLRLRKEGFRPSRDLILALTADEEGGAANGIEWLLKHHRELIDAEFVIDQDDFSVIAENGKAVFYQLDASEKIYADYVVTATNPGGHSSVPRPDNAIYELMSAIARIAKYEFPFELNEVTRAYFEQLSKIERGERARDMQAILKVPPEPAAVERLSRDPMYGSVMHTTCVTTRLAGGHANNALPQRAQATVNCRILPGHSPEEVRTVLREVLADPKMTVQYLDDAGAIHETALSKPGYPATPLLSEVMRPLQVVVASFWPGLQIVPTMSAGTSDAILTSAAGMPSNNLTGIQLDKDDDREHGRDERIGIESFYRGNEFFYRYLKALAAH